MTPELWGIIGVILAIIVQTSLAARWAGKWQERLERVTIDVTDLRKWKHSEVTGFMTDTKLRLGLLEHEENSK